MAAPQVQDASARGTPPVRVKSLCRRLPACATFAIDAIAVHADTLHHLAIRRRPANCGSRSSSAANQYFERNSEPVVQASNHLQ